MKQLKFIAGIFLFLLFGTVSSQYYYFDSGGNTYQQGCSETLDVRINSQNENVRAGRFHLILDPEFVIYPFRSDVSELRSFFNASSNTFMNWSSDASPSWKSGSNNTILQADRSNSQTDYKGENGLYATINFKPQYNESGYSIQFGMEYFSGLDTTETTLSKAGGTELINPMQQNIYRTGIFEVLQEPCIADTNKPTISNFSITSGATKISYDNGISLKLLDNRGVSGTIDVPYIWKNGIWTGNTENRSNQYGIDSGRFELNVSCTNCDDGNAKRVKITNGNSNFTPSGKSWQDLDLNYDVIVNSGELFDFGVEKTIIITGVVYDRAGNFGNININFNKPVAPSLIDDAQNPKANQQYVNLNEAVKLGIKDDWAGVNPGTIRITLSGTNGTEYGPYVFSGSDLNLVPVSGMALTDDFKITISNHEDFPVSGTIRVSWEATDNEGTVGGGNYSFSTRPSCSELQCCDPMEIWLERSGGIYEKITRTGGELYVTGSDLATGYVDGNTGYINCNSLSNGLTLYIRGEQTGNLYVDELNLLGKGVKGIISGNELILSLLVDDITLIADTPYDGQYLNGNNIDFAWHVEGLDSYDWISGYVVEIYSGGELYLTGNINGYNNTGRQQYLPDGEYERDVYAYDEEGNESERSEKNRFIVDNISPELSGQGLIGGLGEDDNCTIQSIFTITGEFTEAVTGVRLTGENVIIKNEGGISNDEISYIWEVELTGGTGKVRLITNEITDLAGNHFSGESKVLVIGNYDSGSIGQVTLEYPLNGAVLTGGNRTGNLIWLGLTNDGCAEISGYEVWLCTGTEIGNTGCDTPIWTGWTNGTGVSTQELEDGMYYWKVQGQDEFGRTGEWSEVWSFSVDNTNPVFTGDGLGFTGGFGDASICITQTGFTIIGTFSEAVTGLRLTGENVIISNEEGISDDGGVSYTWEVELIGGIGEIRLTGNVTDLYGNELDGYGEHYIVGNLDNVGPDTPILNTPDDGYSFDVRDITFTWNSGNTVTGCAEWSGYIFQISTKDGDYFDSNIIGSRTELLVDNTVTSVGIENGTYYWRVISQDKNGNESVSVVRRFEVDSTGVSCVIQEQSECSQTGLITIKDSNDREIISIEDGLSLVWSSGSDGKVWTAPVSQLGELSGIIIEIDGNQTGMCNTIRLQNTDNLDPSVVVRNVTGYECETITGGIIVQTGDMCGKDNLNKFNYNWNGNGYVGQNEYGINSSVSTGKVVNVEIKDAAGNITTTGVTYQWLDRKLIASGNYQLTNYVSGMTVINDLIEVFNVTGYGSCEIVTITTGGCTNATISLDGNDLIIVPIQDYEGIGTCEVYFSDDDGTIETGTLEFNIDTKGPSFTGDGLGLSGGLGDGDNCTSQTGFIITGTFGEAVTGVRLSGENVIINNKEGISTDGITYIWEVELTGGTGTVRLITDGITDLAGNHFSGSSDVLVIGNYDANAPVLDEIIHATGFECQTITGSVSVSDGGCSSGNTILYKWNDIEGEFMHSEYSGRAGTGIFVVSVFDSALNRTDGNVNFVWQDSPITFEHESIDLGVLSGFEYIYSINDLINMFGARDGTCGTGTISLAGGNSSGANVQVNPENVKVNVDVNAEGSGYFEVILSDDEGNEKTGHVDFGIKSRGLRCTIVADRNSCGTGKVNLILTGNGKYLSWNNWSNMVETGLLRQEVINQNQKMFTGYIKNEAGETGICFYNTLDSVLDNQGPTLSNNLFTGYQCDTISVVLAPIDTGCAGNTGFRYSWSGGVWTSNNKGNFLENNVKTGITTVQIVDSLGNLTQNEIVLRWNDMRPSANSFILEAGVGEVDRIEKSDAKEGNCSVDRLTATVLKDGEKGSCVISGKSLTFIPKDFVVSGPDSCTLQVKDPEGNTVDIIVDVRDINKLPSIRLNKPLDGSFFNYGSAVDLSWTVVDPGLAKISGFIYELDSVTGHVSGYTDRTYVSGVVLEPGNYNWKVSMILANTNHKIISTEYKLHVYAAGGPVKDFCPNGDYSNSFYDGTCERQHGSATECVENFEDYSEEQQKAYLYAYLKGITTQCPTTLDGYLYRDHFAKMISVYAMEVVGKVPQYGKSGCDMFDDIADDNQELQDYMKLSCELQLMGLNEDGVTPKTYFDPHSIVTRAEFGTVFSRLIFGDTYNVKNGPEVRHIEGYWYKKHLAALKKYGIMTMVDGDWPKYLERRGRVMIMMDRADSYGLFEGKIPSENGVKALFTQELD